jgi:hypothetical protein
MCQLVLLACVPAEACGSGGVGLASSNSFSDAALLQALYLYQNKFVNKDREQPAQKRIATVF